MKKITITFFAILTLAMSLGSCADFLDVRPKSSSPDYLMFSTPEGFVHAMNGAYLVMRQSIYHPCNHYYGGYYKDAPGFFEFLGCGWVTKGNVLISKDANLYDHNYFFYLLAGDIVSYFKGQYKTITNLNLILKWIDDETQTFLGDEMYSLIKGEALALKAYLLFELIQTYGPPPASANLHHHEYIPYPYTITTAPYSRESYTKFMDLLWTDIMEAERLLEKYDPIIEFSVKELVNAPDLYKRRHNKMNYYALMGLKARVQLYTGDKPGALRSALVVINAKNPDGSEKFPFMEYGKYKAILESTKPDEPADLIGVCEHMFAFEHDRLADSWSMNTQNVNQYFTVYANVSGVYNITAHGKHLLDRFPDAIFANEYGVRGQDVRLEKWFSRSGPTMICQKYYPLTQTNHGSALPILRKGEMLLIAAECEPTLSKAAEYLTILREGRLSPQVDVKVVYLLDTDGNQIIDPDTQKPVIDEEKSIILKAPRTVTFANEDDRMYWIIGEYSREFIMEGRAFFAWKRMGLSKIPYPSAYYDTENPLSGDVIMDDSKYILPIPTSEVYALDY